MQNSRTIQSPIELELATAIYKAMQYAMKIRKDNFETNPHPWALADKMAGELGQAMFGLNTWGDEDIANLTRRVHRLVMDFIDPVIRQAQTKTESAA